MGEINGSVCRYCDGELPAPPPVGRPPRYCSTACRRAAELEVRRVNDRLGELESRASHVRIYGKSSCFAGVRGEKHALAQIETEISVQRSVLLRLLGE